MTPRTVVVMFQEDQTVGEVMRSYRFLPFSRIPIYAESADEVRGYVLRHEIYRRAAADEHEVRLREIARQLDVVPENKFGGASA